MRKPPPMLFAALLPVLLPLSARAADPPLPAAPYTATVYFAPVPASTRPPAVYDIIGGRLIGHINDPGITPGVWSAPDAFTPLPTLPSATGYQPLATDGKTIAAMAFKTKGTPPNPAAPDLNASLVVLWTDPTKPPTLFAPPNMRLVRTYDVWGGQVVGYASLADRPGFPAGPVRPFLFQNNTFTDLTPPRASSAMVQATDGVHQYGSVLYPPGLPNPTSQLMKNGGGPIMWNGASAAITDFTPPGKKGGGIHAARGALQVGSVERHAAVWRGSAASFVDIHPPGFAASFASATNGHRIAGMAQVAADPAAPRGAAPLDRAVVWINQKPASLHALLPAKYLTSRVLRIDAQGNILGSAFDGKGTATIVWKPLPATTQPATKK